ncbi:MAG: AAA family ATPase [Thermoleophilia bacterium]|nr:AAA family ATPase [Thermoleophilia bacterium]
MTFCVMCGTRLPEAARFCPTCGAALSTEAPAEETLKLVTVLFADLVSSTARVERMHPEDVQALMIDYFTAMTEELEAEGGAVEKFVGDAIMAVFGVPLTHEDDALRAVRAGRRMLTRLSLWNEGRGPLDQLEIRIGINTGEVLAAAAARADLLVAGDAVHLAARLQEAADPGAIVIGEATARLARRAFDLRELDPLRLKGRSEPVPAWVVIDERQRAEARAVVGLSAPMVGRERELDILHSILDRVEAERAPHLITVTGDPGVGKSRLAEEFSASLDERTKLMVGRCLAYGEGVTLRPLAEILTVEASILGNDPPETALVKVTQLVSGTVDVGTGSERMTVALASTLGLEPHDGSHEDIDPREIRQRLVASWRALLTGAAAERTLVVVVEDLHWADQTMLDVLDDLAEHVEGPILFLCTARPDVFRVRPNWGGGKHNYSSVKLGPLAIDESERLVSLLLDTEAFPEPVRRSILARAEGNPFFLEEIVRRLIDERLIERVGGRWRAEGQLIDLEIPETVQGVILARIDLLSPAERRALQEAAVVGRVFWSGAVARLVDTTELDEILHTLCLRELIAERLSSTISGETEYVFKHILTRDVAYESLPRRERAQAHTRVAAWIEEMTGKRATELTEILAHHYDVAFSLSQRDDLRGSARRNYLLASQRALRQFALAKAEYLARQAVRLSPAGTERVEALEALGDLSAATHAGDVAWRAYGDALEAVDDEETLGRLAAKAAVQATRWYGGMTEHPTREALERLIARGLEATGDSDSVWRALLLMSRSFELIWGYTEDARSSEDAARMALAIAERLDDPNLLSGSLDAVGSLLLARGLYGDYLRFGRRRIELVPRLTDVAEIGDAFVMGAWNATYVGLYREAVEHATACIERTRAIDPGEYVHGLAWRVWARTMTGDWSGALEDQAELERIQTETAAALPVGYTLKAYSAASFVHELRGERAEATAYLDLVEQFVAAHPASSSLDRDAALALAARAHAHRGHPAEAKALFECGADLQAPPTVEALCEIVAAQEDWVAAPEVIAAARRQAALSEAVALPLFADRLEGRLATAEGDPTRAARLLGRSAGGFAELGALWEEAWSRQLLAEVLIQLSDEQGAQKQRDAARLIFDRLGSVEECERATTLVGSKT